MLRLVPFTGGVLIHVTKHDPVQKASPVQNKAYSRAKATRGGGEGLPGDPPALLRRGPWRCLYNHQGSVNGHHRR